ncbi:MAG: NTP transferase domain-containing protein, partial [bacterium]|nr:NTP transferase domain-containing protein [bacterium]
MAISEKTGGPGRTAIVLVGGKSRRMGDDKALLARPGDERRGTLLEGLIRQLEDNFHEIIICTSQPGRQQFANYLAEDDPAPRHGPLMGILTGLRASSNAINFVV